MGVSWDPHWINRVHLRPNGREMVHAVASSEAVRSSVVALERLLQEYSLEARLCKLTCLLQRNSRVGHGINNKQPFHLSEVQ